MATKSATANRATSAPTSRTPNRATSTNPRSPGKSPNRATTTTPGSTGRSPNRATTTTPRSPGKSPTRATSGTGRTATRPRSPYNDWSDGIVYTPRSSKQAEREASEHMMTRALQSFMLLGGVFLFSTFLFGGKWGPALIGLLIFASAFPPARRHADRWLVGTTRGDDADNAAILRLVVGVAVVIGVLLFVPG